MTDYDNNSDTLKHLLSIPRKNLESRIQQLENSINSRQMLNDLILSTFCTKRIQLKEQIERSHYSIDLFNTRNKISSELSHIEELITREKTNSLHEIHTLHEKIQLAKEELNKVRGKLRIIDS